MALLSTPVTETRGEAARRRRDALGVSRDAVAHEAGVSVKTLKSYEEDAPRDMSSSAPKIEAALERLERTGQEPRQRRATDTPTRRIIDAVIEGAEGELAVRVLADGTRAIFIVPQGGHTPTDEEIQKVLRDLGQ